MRSRHTLHTATMAILIGLAAHTAAAQGRLVQKYYDQDSLHIKERYFIDTTAGNQLSGPFQSFYYTGSPESEGSYTGNQPVGFWKYYYENGNTKMEGELRNTSNYGHWVYYFESGGKRMEGELREGKRQGEWTFYFENGTVKNKGTFTDGLRSEIWNYFYEDGTLKAQAYFRNGRGKYQEFFTSGNKKADGLIVDGKSDSLWRYYYEAGNLKSEGQYINGVKEGEWKTYHKNSNVAEQGNFLGGEKVGSWSYYYENGQLSSTGIERQGQKEGYWKLYYETGQLLGEGEYESGNGRYREYYESGQLKVSGHIKKGKSHGQWKYYYEDGSIEGTCTFKEGKGEYTGYYDNGAKKMVGMIDNNKKVGRWRLFKKNGKLEGYYNPVYEEDTPIFKFAKESQLVRKDYEKPEYLYRRRKVRYFVPQVNEYRSVIISTNPLAPLVGYLPVSLELYFQERLGYEILFAYRQDPFFTEGPAVSPNTLYNSGFSISFRQKLYERNDRWGMFYFGHELNYTSLEHKLNFLDSTLGGNVRVFTADEQRFEYGLYVGDRFIKDAGKGGFTLDIFVGLAVGYRSFNRDYDEGSEASLFFDELNQSNISTQFNFGLLFGFMGPTKKSSTIK